jgi:methionyl-tRNA formyltransferase
MKILLCLNQDIHCIAAFNYLLPELKNHQIGIYFSSGVGKVPDNKYLKNLRDCEWDLRMENIQLIAEKSRVKINLKTFLNIEQIRKKIQIFDFKNINFDGLEYLSKNWQPDLIISIRFGQIFQNPIIALPKFGVINLHSGVLPNYRGILATFWAMLNKEKEIGTTLHYVLDGSIDTGDIIGISKIKADYSQPLINNIFKLYPLGASMIIDVLVRIEKNLQIRTIKQNRDGGRYFSYPDDVNIEEFIKKIGTLF